MDPSKSYNHHPAPDDSAEQITSQEFAEQLKLFKAALAEAEDLCAEFAIAKYLEAKRLSKEIGKTL